jgi:AefR-like transcriptional repressor, C-terminal domain
VPRLTSRGDWPGSSRCCCLLSAADKQSLFREIVTGTVAEVGDPVAEQIASLRDSTDLSVGLQGLARALLAQVIQPRVMQLRRLVIGEAGRFPELGRLFTTAAPAAPSTPWPPPSKASPPAGPSGSRTRG